MKAKKIGLFWIFFIAVSSLWAQDSPVPMLEHSANQIIATLKQNKSKLKNDHHIIYQAVERHLLPNVDVVGMSRSVLGREAWLKASAAEKAEFTKVFTKLVIRTYANPLAEYNNETVRFLPQRGSNEQHFTRVNSIITRSNGQTIPMSYSLVVIGNNWKIYDLSVEGVSLLQSFRSQFTGILHHSSMKELISEMRKNPKVGSS